MLKEERRPTIGALIITKNEAENLPRALASIAWMDKVHVVDSGSTDRTREIASEHGASFIEHPFTSYSQQRNFALDELDWGVEWVLVLDADERVSPELHQGIVRAALTDGPNCYEVNRLLIWQGTEIRHCGWFPSWHLRFFRLGSARYEDRPVGEHMIPTGPVGRLEGLLIHDDQRSINRWFERHCSYAQMEAEARTSGLTQPLGGRAFAARSRRRLKRTFWPKLPTGFRPILLFLYLYILRLGFLDGAAGLRLCLLHGWHEWTIGLRERELRDRRLTPGSRALNSRPTRGRG